MRDFRRIKVYQKAETLVLTVCRVTKDFPKDELYGLTSQLRRAVVSIACNIAEGASRQHEKDYVHFPYIARASLAEVRCLIGLSAQLGYLSQADQEPIEISLEESSKMLYGLIRTIKEGL